MKLEEVAAALGLRGEHPTYCGDCPLCHQEALTLVETGDGNGISR